MRVQVNPDTQPSGEFGYAPAGTYTLRVKEVTQQQKEGSPFPYLKWTFEFADPNVEAANNESGKPPKKVGNVFENTTLKPEAQFRLRDLCDALGVKWGDFDTDEVIGMECQARVKVDEYNGEFSNKVGKFIPA